MMDTYSTGMDTGAKANRQLQVDLELQNQEFIIVSLETVMNALVVKLGKLYLERTEKKDDEPSIVKERYCALADTLRTNNAKFKKISKRLNDLVDGIEISGLQAHREGQPTIEEAN